MSDPSVLHGHHMFVLCHKYNQNVNKYNPKRTMQVSVEVSPDNLADSVCCFCSLSVIVLFMYYVSPVARGSTEVS